MIKLDFPQELFVIVNHKTKTPISYSIIGEEYNRNYGEDVIGRLQQGCINRYFIDYKPSYTLLTFHTKEQAENALSRLTDTQRSHTRYNRGLDFADMKQSADCVVMPLPVYFPMFVAKYKTMPNVNI